jgi:hypothetical protein
MPVLSAQTLPLLPAAHPSPMSGRGKSAKHDVSSAAGLLWRESDANDVPDRSYWTAYDHFMVEREARAMRRTYAWALLAKAWSALVRR